MNRLAALVLCLCATTAHAGGDALPLDPEQPDGTITLSQGTILARADSRALQRLEYGPACQHVAIERRWNSCDGIEVFLTGLSDQIELMAILQPQRTGWIGDLTWDPVWAAELKTMSEIQQVRHAISMSARHADLEMSLDKMLLPFTVDFFKPAVYFAMERTINGEVERDAQLYLFDRRGTVLFGIRFGPAVQTPQDAFAAITHVLGQYSSAEGEDWSDFRPGEPVMGMGALGFAFNQADLGYDPSPIDAGGPSEEGLAAAILRLGMSIADGLFAGP